jgi:hypothetical protein
MRKLRIVLGAFLLSTLATTGLTFAFVAPNQPPGGEGGGTTCGAWEPRGGAGDGFQRLCINGSLHWYEYQ